jgi:hypothetical protein
MASTRNAAVTGIDDIVKGLDKLSDMAAPVMRAMGAAMGNEVRDEAIERAPILQPGNEGFDNQRRNQLKEAIYNAFDGRRSILGAHVVYGVSWNRRKAPHGHLLEFGHRMPFEPALSHGKWFTPIRGVQRVDGRKRGVGTPHSKAGYFIKAQPFLGPAFDAKLPRLSAIAAAAGAVAFSDAMR